MRVVISRGTGLEAGDELHLSELAIYCADVGSLALGHFAWARATASRRALGVLRDSDSIDALVETVAADLAHGSPVSLGFECPLFVPLAVESVEIGRSRAGEGSRPWSAGAGAGALATGLPQAIWLLQEIRRRVPTAHAYLRWDEFAAAGAGMFLWEAFVSGAAKGLSHREDAAIGVRAFAAALPSPQEANAVPVKGEIHSLIGAALLRTGWGTDVALLAEPCVVIRAAPR